MMTKNNPDGDDMEGDTTPRVPERNLSDTINEVVKQSLDQEFPMEVDKEKIGNQIKAKVKKQAKFDDLYQEEEGRVNQTFDQQEEDIDFYER